MYMPFFGPPDIGALQGKRDIAGLIKALSYKENSTADKHVYVRRKAAQALGQLRDAQAIGPLTERLADRDEGVRIYAVSALGEIGDTRAVEPLKGRLKDSESRVRESAKSALDQLGYASAVPQLIVGSLPASFSTFLKQPDAAIALQGYHVRVRWNGTTFVGEYMYHDSTSLVLNYFVQVDEHNTFVREYGQQELPLDVLVLEVWKPGH
jgi:hypothetical protein